MAPIISKTKIKITVNVAIAAVFGQGAVRCLFVWSLSLQDLVLRLHPLKLWLANDIYSWLRDF